MNLFKQLLESSKNHSPIHILTLLTAPSDKPHALGQMLLIHNGSLWNGCLLDDFFTSKVIDTVLKNPWKKPTIIEINYNNDSYRLFWDQLSGNCKAIILGGGHISQPLVDMLALLTFEVTVIDDRPLYANNYRFPNAQRVICGNFTEVLTKSKPYIDEQTAVIIITRGHTNDLECLRTLIGINTGYLGMIGSQRRIQTIIDILKNEGIHPQRLERLRAPIGLDIGAQSPAEIALSIAAEVVAAFRGGTCIPLSRKAKEFI